ncbi:MAG TPA: glycosyltransferase family 9 protein [Candidatus Limnocylindrales bacterium]|nr:glycosyltransferase family 9 protein [Candidatus Limnocylindrales bacterium]
MSSDPATFYSRTRNARKIIVVDLGFLGDTVHLVPALWELKRNYSQAQLHVLTSTVGKEVLRLAPWLDRVWDLEMYRETRTLGQQLMTLRAVRSEQFEVAFLFSASDRAVWMTALTGARRRLGARGDRWHFYNRWLVHEWAAKPDPDLIVFEQRRRVLADCGLDLKPAEFNLTLDQPSTDWAAGVVPDLALHISPSSAKATREWPIEHHTALLRTLWTEFPKLHVMISSSGRPREHQRLRTLETSVNDKRLHSLPGDFTISQLAAVLRRCCLHIGPDSGVLHLAVALGVPTISFFRQQGAYKSFMPSGALHQVISMPCYCIDQHHAPCEPLGRGECFVQIQPGLVAELVRKRLSGDHRDSGTKRQQ